MNIQTWVNERHGRATKLAQALNIKPPSVSAWVTGKKRVPIQQCMPIERATDGAVTRRDLRPDDFHIHWPDLAQAQPMPASQATPATAESGS